MYTKESVIDAIKKVIDPDLFIDIWTLGLIYDIAINGENVDVTMTFTSPMCPSGPQLVGDLKSRVMEIDGVENVEVEITFEPQWEPSDELKAMMGMM